MLASSAALAFEPFVVKDIRVEGVQRTEAGTVFSYLPVKVGERLDDEKASQAVKALFATGFFRDVRLEVQDGVLIVVVQERPTISRVDFSGNKEFDTDTLKKALKDIGLVEARIFDRSALERAEQEMKRQYISRGRYGAKVTTTATPQERNRVAINFTIEEGESAKIARINIVGAQVFTEKELLGEMQLTTPGWTTWYTKNDQYSKQKLQADLEKLRSFYQNRGYLEFNVESTQVSITPDKEDIYITVNIVEGPQFRVGDVRLAGDLMVPEAELRQLLRLRTGDIYSREKLQGTAKDISDRLGAEGFAFANVNAVPEIDQRQARRLVHGLRRLRAAASTSARSTSAAMSGRRDEVIRREMRQLESAWYDGPRIDRSKVRMRRLGYFDDVNIETPSVAGTTDQADVEVTVTERTTGSLNAGVGYSSSDGVVLYASVSQHNVFGTGNSLVATINTSKVNRKIARHVHRALLDRRRRLALARGLLPERRTRRRCRCRLPVADAGAAIGFGVPLTETDSVNLGVRYEHTASRCTATARCCTSSSSAVRRHHEQLHLLAGWSRDTRDNILFPTRAPAECWSRSGSVGDLSYYKVNYLNQWFYPSDATSCSCSGPTWATPTAWPTSRCRSSRRSTPAASARSAATRPRRWARGTFRQLDRRQAQDRRQRRGVLSAVTKGDQSVRMSVFADAGQI